MCYDNLITLMRSLATDVCSRFFAALVQRSWGPIHFLISRASAGVCDKLAAKWGVCSFISRNELNRMTGAKSKSINQKISSRTVGQTLQTERISMELQREN